MGFIANYIKPIASSRWTAAPLLSEPPSAKPSGNPSRLAALYISSPESECRYSCRLIETPDRFSERPPRGGLSLCAEHDRQLGGRMPPLRIRARCPLVADLAQSPAEYRARHAQDHAGTGRNVRGQRCHCPRLATTSAHHCSQFLDALQRLLGAAGQQCEGCALVIGQRLAHCRDHQRAPCGPAITGQYIAKQRRISERI